jgi:hypothetical protein
MTQVDDLKSEGSQNSYKMSEQLKGLIQNAEAIQSPKFQKFKDELSSKLLWLRPSVNGISAISYCAETPQRGFSKISISNLGRKMEQQLSPPGRPTPEKQLQSWLIQSALKAGGNLKLLDDLLGGTHWFVSDEIAIRTASDKVVADLLLVRVVEGLASLVNVELKSNRAMETFRQVICFRAVLEHPELQASWRTFAEVMTDKKFRWHSSKDTRGIVVWRKLKDKNRMNVLANTKREKYPRVEVIGYEAVEGELNNYALTLE